MFLFTTATHARRVANTLPADNLSATQHAVQALAFTFAFIGLIAAIAYVWADRKDQREIDAILKKHGIK